MMLSPELHPSAHHIAILMHDFSTGGSERVAIRLANRWAQTGRRVTILCGVGHGPARELVDAQVKIVTVWPEIPRSLLSRITLAHALAGCIGVLRPDIVFSPGNFHISVMGITARLLGPDRPAMITKLSNPLKRDGRSHALQLTFGRMLRWFSSPIDGFVAMSDTLRDEAIQVLGRAHVTMIHEPNASADQPQLARALSEARHPVVLCAGRLEPQKNFELAIRAFARLDPAIGARLRILGEGRQRLKLEMLVDQLGLNDRISIEGYVADIRPALARANLFLLSSRYEGYPAVLIEALAAGVPCVATNCSPALGEIIDHASLGSIVESDAETLARAMTAWLRRPVQSIDASDLLSRHRLNGVADRYLDLFDHKVMERTRRPLGQAHRSG